MFTVPLAGAVSQHCSCAAQLTPPPKAISHISTRQVITASLARPNRLTLDILHLGALSAPALGH